MLSDKMKTARLRKGLTLKQVAEKMGVSEATVQRWESGYIQTLKYERLLQLADVLGTTPVYLADLEGDNFSTLAVKVTGNIPIYGTIAAGEPLFMDENIIDYSITTEPHPERFFGLKVKGLSMIGAGINDGAYVILKKQNTAENGQIVACRVNGDEATLKRFKRIGDNVILSPENSDYDPIIVSAKDFENGVAQIIGVAVQIITKLE